MRALTQSVHVERPPDAVWALLTDLERAPRWRPLIKRMATADGGPLAAGSVVVVTTELMGREHARRSTTTCFEPGRRWTLQSASPGYTGIFDYRVDAEGSGTRVTHTADIRPSGLRAWLMLPLVIRGDRRHRRRALPNLKRLLEGSP